MPRKPASRARPRTSAAATPRPGSVSQVADRTRAGDVDAAKAGLNRRAFIRAVIAGAGTVGFIADVGGIRSVLADVLDLDADERLLKQVCGIGTNSSAALIPAANHPWQAPPRGMPYYPIEKSCCDAFRSRFLPDVTLRTVTGYPQIRADDSLYLFGSQVSNLLSRSYLGEPWLDAPVFQVQNTEWQATLRWNLHALREAAPTHRIQFDTFWQSATNVIADRLGATHQARAGTGWMDDDYLLLTVLPRYARGTQRVFIFGGSHGPGTRGAAILFSSPVASDLTKLLAQTRGEPFFQALFHVRVVQDERGELWPARVELIEAEPVEVSF